MDKLISKNEFNKLASWHDQHCVSIYIPTTMAGVAGEKQQGPLRLKNALKQVKEKLNEYKLSPIDIENYLEPVKNLMDDKLFWGKQSNCLAIFLSKQLMQVYSLPVNNDSFIYVSDHFYLLPIMSLFNGNGKFFILSLSLKDIKLYEATRYNISRVHAEDLLPEKLEEVVGHDFHNKSLQFRSGQGGEAGAMFHGQGAGKDDKDAELEKYFRAVDKGLMKLIKDENAQLILACVDHYHPVYAKITDYPNLFKQNISGNHDETDAALLHKLALPLVEGYFQQYRKKYAELIRNLPINGKTSFDLNDIIPAAIDGRIEVLFVQKSRDKYGLYDEVNRSLIVDENTTVSQASLYNLAAIQTWLKGGHVYLAEKDEMPLLGSGINALFRY